MSGKVQVDTQFSTTLGVAADYAGRYDVCQGAKHATVQERDGKRAFQRLWIQDVVQLFLI